MTDRQRSIPFVMLLLTVTASVVAQTPGGLRRYVTEDAPSIVLVHVRVIDGTGAQPAKIQRIEIANGKIVGTGRAGSRRDYPARARVLDLTGRTVTPHLVGMHEHLFYPTPGAVDDGVPLYAGLADSAPRLYLAGGVTTARTAGSMQPSTDLVVIAGNPADKIEAVEAVESVFKDGRGYDPVALVRAVQDKVGLRQTPPHGAGGGLEKSPAGVSRGAHRASIDARASFRAGA